MKSIAEMMMVMAQQSQGEEEPAPFVGHCMYSPVITALCTLSSLILQSMAQKVLFAPSIVTETVVMMCAVAGSMLNRPGTLAFALRVLVL